MGSQTDSTFVKRPVNQCSPPLPAGPDALFDVQTTGERGRDRVVVSGGCVFLDKSRVSSL